MLMHDGDYVNRGKPYKKRGLKSREFSGQGLGYDRNIRDRIIGKVREMSWVE